jgi:hypothetical protein
MRTGRKSRVPGFQIPVLEKKFRHPWFQIPVLEDHIESPINKENFRGASSQCLFGRFQTYHIFPPPANPIEVQNVFRTHTYSLASRIKKKQKLQHVRYFNSAKTNLLQEGSNYFLFFWIFFYAVYAHRNFLCNAHWNTYILCFFFSASAPQGKNFRLFVALSRPTQKRKIVVRAL